jgi:hypothetical protein
MGMMAADCREGWRGLLARKHFPSFAAIVPICAFLASKRTAKSADRHLKGLPASSWLGSPRA